MTAAEMVMRDALEWYAAGHEDGGARARAALALLRVTVERDPDEAEPGSSPECGGCAAAGEADCSAARLRGRCARRAS